MNILLLVIIMLYQIGETIFSVKKMNKLKQTKITEKIRVRFYRETIISGWIPAIIITLFIIFDSITINNIGLRTINFSNYTWLNIITIIIILIILSLIFYQIIMFITSKKYRKSLELQINKKNKTNNHYDRVITNIMLPRTFKEKVWFSFVSLTAGICEEITWRGTLIFLLQSIFPTINIVLIILIASALFGVFHSYQGIQGVIKTGLVGILFNLLYIVSDSLLFGIIIHFFVDFSSLFVLSNKKYSIISKS